MTHIEDRIRPDAEPIDGCLLAGEAVSQSAQKPSHFIDHCKTFMARPRGTFEFTENSITRTDIALTAG